MADDFEKTELYTAILSNDTEQVEQTLASNPHLLKKYDKNGETYLHMAVRRKSLVSMLEALLFSCDDVTVLLHRNNHGRNVVDLVLYEGGDPSLLEVVASYLTNMMATQDDEESSGVVIKMVAEGWDFWPLSGLTAKLNVKTRGYLKAHIEAHEKIEEIHQACENGDMALLKRLLERKYLGHVRDVTGMTPLHKAVLLNQVPVAQYLLKSFRASVTAADHMGRTPLHYAATQTDEGAFLYDLMTLFTTDKDLQWLDKTGYTCEDYKEGRQQLDLEAIKDAIPTINMIPRVEVRMYEIHEAIKDGDLKTLKMLLDRKEYSTLTDHTGMNPLHKAVLHEQTDIVRYLVTAFPDLLTIYAADPYGRTPLHIAAKLRDKGLYKILVYAGADEEAETVTGYTPEMYKEQVSATEIQDIKDYVDTLAYIPKAQNKVDQLHRAVQSGRLSAVKGCLSSRGLVHTKDSSGLPILHKAVVFEHADIVRYLLSKFPETMWGTDYAGRLPLHYAAGVRDKGYLYKILLSCATEDEDGNAVQDKQDRAGKTPEHYKEHPDELELSDLKLRLRDSAIKREGHVYEPIKTPVSRPQSANSVHPTRSDLNTPAPSRPASVRDKPSSRPQSRAQSAADSPRKPSSRPAEEVPETSRTSSPRSRPHTGTGQRSRPSSSGSRPGSSRSGTPLTIKPDVHIIRPVTPNPKFRESKLYKAIVADQAKEVEDLLRKDNPEDAHLRDFNGDTYLHVAVAFSASPPVLKILLQHVDITHRNDQGLTALDAAIFGNTNLNAAKIIFGDVRKMITEGELKYMEHALMRGWTAWLDVDPEKFKDFPEGPAYLQGHRLHVESKVKDISTAIQESSLRGIRTAIQEGSLRGVKRLLDRRALVSSADSVGLTPLHTATLYQEDRILEYLLTSYSGSPNLTDNMGRTPLHYAGALGSRGMDLYDMLVQFGADQDLPDRRGFTPSDYLDRKAHINMEALKQLAAFLDKMPTLRERLREIHEAVTEGDLAILKQLIDRKQYITTRDATGLPPIHKAVVFEQTDILRYLLRAHPAAMDCLDAAGRTPLHHAAALTDKGYLYHLLLKAGARDDIKDEDGQLAQYYLENREVLDPRMSRENCRLLVHVTKFLTQVQEVHEAVKAGSLARVRGSLSFKRLASARDHTGLPPLHKAVVYEHADIVRYLVTHYPDSLQQDHLDRTALHYAAVLRDKGYIYRIVAKANAEEYIQDVHGNTPLNYKADPSQIDLKALKLRLDGKHPFVLSTNVPRPPSGHRPSSVRRQRSRPSSRSSMKSPDVDNDRSTPKSVLSEVDVPLGITPTPANEKKNNVESPRVQSDQKRPKHATPRTAIGSPKPSPSSPLLDSPKEQKQNVAESRSKPQPPQSRLRAESPKDKKVESPRNKMDSSNKKMDSQRTKEEQPKNKVEQPKPVTSGKENKPVARVRGSQRKDATSERSKTPTKTEETKEKKHEMSPKPADPKGTPRKAAPKGTPTKADPFVLQPKASTEKGQNTNYLIEQLGPALTLALAEVCQKQPRDPIDFIAGYLHKYKHSQSFEKQLKAEEEELQKVLQEQEMETERQRHIAVERSAMLEEQKVRQKQFEEQESKRLREEEREKRRREQGSPTMPTLKEEDERERDEKGRTPLHLAAGKPDGAKEVQKLLSQGFSLSDRDMEGKTPKDHAMEARAEATVKALDDFVVNMAKDEDWGSIERLVLAGYGSLLPDLAQAVTRGNQQDPDDRGNIEAIHVLMSNIRDCFEHAFNGNMRHLRHSLSKKKLAHARNQQGQTLLHVATEEGHVTLMKYLSTKYPSIVNLRDCMGRTPLHYARLRGSQDVTDLLTQAGAREHTDLSGHRPGSYAAK